MKRVGFELRQKRKPSSEHRQQHFKIASTEGKTSGQTERQTDGKTDKEMDRQTAK